MITIKEVEELTQKWIKRKIANINHRIEVRQAQKNFIQNICTHPNVVSVDKGNTGNWDRQDTYWQEHNCPDCEKRWTTPQ